MEIVCIGQISACQTEGNGEGAWASGMPESKDKPVSEAGKQ